MNKYYAIVSKIKQFNTWRLVSRRQKAVCRYCMENKIPKEIYQGFIRKMWGEYNKKYHNN